MWHIFQAEFFEEGVPFLQSRFGEDGGAAYGRGKGGPAPCSRARFKLCGELSLPVRVRIEVIHGSHVAYIWGVIGSFAFGHFRGGSGIGALSGRHGMGLNAQKETKNQAAFLAGGPGKFRKPECGTILPYFRFT